MKTEELIVRAQDSLYNNLNTFSTSEKHPRLFKNLGRLSFLPIAVLNTASDLLKFPLVIVEGVARTVLNLMGAAFFKRCTLNQAMDAFTYSLAATISFPFYILISPLEVLCQAVRIVRDPTVARPFLEKRSNEIDGE